MKSIGYYIANFPKLSETFISREVLLLKNLDQDVNVFASNKPDLDEQNFLGLELETFINETYYINSKRAIWSLFKNIFLFNKYYPLAKKLSKEATNKPNSLVLLGRAIILSKFCKINKIEHLHAHWPYATMVVYLTHKISGISYSISIHAHEMFHENGHFKRTLPDIKFSAFCNKAAMQVVLDKYPQLKEKCHLIYHGVNLNNFPFLKMPELDDTIRIVTAGRLTKTKGFDRLIRACSDVKKSGIKIKLSILGIGDLKNQLIELANDLDFSNDLDMPGWVNREQVRDYMSQSHIFALLADVNYHDGLPNVALEAMAVGRPVIISPLPAAREAVQQDVNGFVLSKKDAYDEFEALIQRIVSKEIDINSMGTNARKTIEDKFADNVHINHMVKLLNE